MSQSKSIGALNNIRNSDPLSTTTEHDDNDDVVDSDMNPFKKSTKVTKSPPVTRKNVQRISASAKGANIDEAFRPSNKMINSPREQPIEEQKLPHHEVQSEPTPSTFDGTRITSVTGSSSEDTTNDILSVPPSTASLSDHSRLSTATSTISNTHYQHLQVKTPVTLKSPFEGTNLGPPTDSPENFLGKAMEEMGAGDWETNVKGMSGVVRMARHMPEYLLVEYKQVLALVMKHVKNLRSQVRNVQRRGCVKIAKYFPS